MSNLEIFQESERVVHLVSTPVFQDGFRNEGITLDPNDFQKEKNQGSNLILKHGTGFLMNIGHF